MEDPDSQSPRGLRGSCCGATLKQSSLQQVVAFDLTLSGVFPDFMDFPPPDPQRQCKNFKTKNQGTVRKRLIWPNGLRMSCSLAPPVSGEFMVLRVSVASRQESRCSC